MQTDIQNKLITENQLADKVKELGTQISKDYAGKEVVAVCILKGATIFYADLIRNISLPLQTDFMAISSYGNSRKSSGVVQIIKDLDKNIENKHVLIIEDIMDSGQTLAYLMDLLGSRNPLSIKICCLLDKPSCRVANINPDYIGFEIPNEFVVGYGLDFAEKYRNLPFVGILKPEVYA